LERVERVLERLSALAFAAARGGWVGNAPVCRHGMPRPHRAGLARRLIADRDDEIHLRRIRLGELVPAPAAQTLSPQAESGQEIKRQRMNGPFGKAAGAEAPEAALPPMVHQRLRENAARGIAGAEEKDVQDVAHGWTGPPQHGVGSALAASFLTAPSV